MDDGGTGEIIKRYRVHIGEPAIGSPRPVADNRIDEASDTDAVQQVADEITAQRPIIAPEVIVEQVSANAY